MHLKYSVDFPLEISMSEAISISFLFRIISFRCVPFEQRFDFIIFHILMISNATVEVSIAHFTLLFHFNNLFTISHCIENGSCSLLWSPLGILMRWILNYLFIWNMKLKNAFSCLCAISFFITFALSHSLSTLCFDTMSSTHIFITLHSTFRHPPR